MLRHQSRQILKLNRQLVSEIWENLVPKSRGQKRTKNPLIFGAFFIHSEPPVAHDIYGKLSSKRKRYFLIRCRNQNTAKRNRNYEEHNRTTIFL